jgi:putative transposase
MPRTARRLSNTGIYHIMVRGINRQPIFYEEEDYQRYLNTLGRTIDKSDAVILGYCLMNNHVHLLIQDCNNAIATVMKSIGTSYAYWYNHKYERSGHVFQDRYKSENVEDDAYLMTVIRYIHQNPVKAGIIAEAESYLWSSYRIYCGTQEYPPGLTKTSLVLGMFAQNEIQAIEAFRRYMREFREDLCMDDTVTKNISDSQAIKIMTEIIGDQSISNLSTMPKPERDILLKQCKSVKGISLRQLARISGLGYQTVNRA